MNSTFIQLNGMKYSICTDTGIFVFINYKKTTEYYIQYDTLHSKNKKKLNTSKI